jgi:mannitol/fructose-specific phosphotransferase system IIA component (Ntr-type)
VSPRLTASTVREPRPTNYLAPSPFQKPSQPLTANRKPQTAKLPNCQTDNRKPLNHSRVACYSGRRILGERELINTKTIESLRSAGFLNPLTASSEIEAIRRLLEELKTNPLVADLAELDRAIIERQKVDPPFLPMGVAFPHARTDSVRGIVIVIGISPQPIQFSAGSARLVLLIGAPKKAVAEYLELTSFLARHLRGENVLDRLMGTTNIDEFLTAFAAAP